MNRKFFVCLALFALSGFLLIGEQQRDTFSQVEAVEQGVKEISDFLQDDSNS